jgi:hypothetical protein
MDLFYRLIWGGGYARYWHKFDIEVEDGFEDKLLSTWSGVMLGKRMENLVYDVFKYALGIFDINKEGDLELKKIILKILRSIYLIVGFWNEKAWRKLSQEVENITELYVEIKNEQSDGFVDLGVCTFQIRMERMVKAEVDKIRKIYVWNFTSES